MNSFRFLMRTIRHYRIVDIGIVLSVAVCVMALVGAVIVGDSVTASLHSIVENRLGDTDHLLISPRFFNASLAERLERSAGFNGDFLKARAYLKTSGVCRDTETGAMAARVNVFGAESIEPGNCIVSRRLARQLRIYSAENGPASPATVVLRMDPRQYVSAELPVGRDRTNTAMLRLKIAGIAEPGGFLDRFSIHGTQRPVKNIWTSLEELQRALASPGAANLVAVTARRGKLDKANAGKLQEMLASVATLDDYGLFFRKPSPGSEAAGANTLILESKELLISSAVEKSVKREFPEAVGVFAYVADTIRSENNGRECPYPLVAGVGRLPDGSIGTDSVVLNSWAADDLQAVPGSRVKISFFKRNAGGLPVKSSKVFTLDRVIATKGTGADDSLVPEYKMITSAKSIADWEPPRDFEFHSERIRPIDEDYWDKYRAAPRAFINLGTAQAAWRTRYGALSSVRFSGLSEDEVSRRLLKVLKPSELGLNFRPIRFEQLNSAKGTTDFGQLFIGLGSFLAASSLLLVALVVVLLIERRFGQIGMLFALGFTLGRIRRLFLAEGLLLVAVGGVLGVLLSIGYAWLSLEGLKTIWSDAIGTSQLSLSINGASVAASLLISLFICAVVIWRKVALVGKMSVAAAVSGKRSPSDVLVTGKHGPSFVPAMIFVVLAAVAAAGAFAGAWSNTAGFYAAGACLLAAAISFMRRFFAASRADRTLGAKGISLMRIGLRNAARNPTRSLLTVGLVASSLFVLVSVSAMRQRGPKRPEGDSRLLIASFDIPLLYDLSTAKGLEYLGVSDAAPWRDSKLLNLRSTSGDDVSCRNLYRASNPRVTSVPAGEMRLVENNFASAVSNTDNPWELLEGVREDGSIPVIADYDAAMWGLHKRLGETVDIVDEGGNKKHLRIVALLRKSIFQGELLMDESNYQRLFPTSSGCSQMLAIVSPSRAEALRNALARDLADFGVTVETREERLAAFAGIAGAYISAFEALGGLGTILGVLGLVVILARGVAERRGEIALLFALGFPHRSVARLLAFEYVFLLACGMVAGIVSAVFAILPEYLSSGVSPVSILYTFLFLGFIGGIIIFVLTGVSSRLVRRISPAALRIE